MSICAKCGEDGDRNPDADVRSVSPDMDITPVPLCVICRWGLIASLFGSDPSKKGQS